MEQTTQAADWIGAYLEWNGIERAPYAVAGNQAAAVDFSAAYLEWQESSAPSTAGSRASTGEGRGRRASDVFAGSQGFREAVLLAALHAQSDCVHILRQVLDHGSAGVGTVRLASEALEHAQRLLDDERLAWHALGALRGNGHRRATDAWRSTIDGEWPQALEHVASDVRSLTSTVLAMQFH